MNKRTVVLGASPNSSRYSYLAVMRLQAHGHTVMPIGRKRGQINGEEIIIGPRQIENVDTITLYLNAQNQKQYYNYILSLHPKRIIFNPGAENRELAELAEKNNLKVMPLLQVYGHLEYVLKLKEFMHLREDKRYPQVITPCLEESYKLIFGMLIKMNR